MLPCWFHIRILQERFFLQHTFYIILLMHFFIKLWRKYDAHYRNNIYLGNRNNIYLGNTRVDMAICKLDMNIFEMPFKQNDRKHIYWRLPFMAKYTSTFVHDIYIRDIDSSHSKQDMILKCLDWYSHILCMWSWWDVLFLKCKMFKCLQKHAYEYIVLAVYCVTSLC